MREQSYHFKPRTKMIGSDAHGYHVGVELEVEAPDAEGKATGLAIKKVSHDVYAKHDGSLGQHGIELVTHPISPDVWLDPRCKVVGPDGKFPGREYHSNASGRFLRLVEQLKGLGYTSHDNNRCGLHVHVSRTALSEPGLTWFRRLFHGELIARLSLRNTFQYCARRPADCWLDAPYRQNNRYEAVNLTDKTVEVRIFRGNMRRERILAAIELVIAAVEFCRHIPAESNGWSAADLDDHFAAWLMSRDTYRHASARVTEVRGRIEL